MVKGAIDAHAHAHSGCIVRSMRRFA